jgi:Inner membrane component of T3SS, cytoplasmic domain
MVRLKILSGKMAGSEHEARHFPFLLGRGAAADLRTEDDGLWERHAELALDGTEGFVLKAQEEALVTVNGHPCREASLRNGDEVALGGLKPRFWIGPTRQRSLWFREGLVWAVIILVTAAQFVLIYRVAP